MKNILRRFPYYFLNTLSNMAVFPVSLWIKLVKLTINFARRNGLSKSVGIHDICLGRRLIELHESLNDERVLERDEVNCKLSYLDVGTRGHY